MLVGFPQAGAGSILALAVPLDRMLPCLPDGTDGPADEGEAVEVGQLNPNVSVFARLRHPTTNPAVKRGPATVRAVLGGKLGEQGPDRHGMGIGPAHFEREGDHDRSAVARRTDAARLGVGGAKVARYDGLPRVDGFGLGFGLHGMGWEGVEVGLRVGKGSGFGVQ